MYLRRMLLTFLLTAVVTAVAVAQTITITVVQDTTAPEVALSMSRVLEDEILGSYFENGKIVTNTDIAFDGHNYTEKNYGVKKAAHGLSDYVLVVYMHYGPGEKKHEKLNVKYAELKKASWRLVHVKSIKTIGEQDLDLSAVPIREFDPYMQIRMLGAVIAQNSLTALREAGKGETH
ncbi:MAG TPA: hypothetical protein GXZ47_06415 [Treponema sp.]|nr:hypothetical protein [Treponema sp.]